MIVLVVGAKRVVHSAYVGVGIDQARHDGMIAGVDDRGIPWDRYLAGRSYGGDPVAGNHDGPWAVGVRASGVEDDGILQDQCLSHIILIAGRNGTAAWGLSQSDSKATNGSGQY